MVAHFDVGAIARLLPFEELLEEAAGGDADEVLQIMGMVERSLGFDPLEDIESVTVFTNEFPPDQPQVMLIVNERGSELIKTLRDEGALRSARRSKVGIERLYAQGIIDLLGVGEEVSEDEHIAIFAQPLRGGRHAVLDGERESDIRDAAEALSGDASTLDSRRGDLMLDAKRGALLYVEAAASFEELARRTPASRFASKLQSVAFQASEDDGMLHLEVNAAVGSERDAKAMVSVVEGLRGLLALADVSREVPEMVQDALASAEARADGDRVQVQLSVPIGDLMEAFRAEVSTRRRGAYGEEAERPARRGRRKKF